MKVDLHWKGNELYAGSNWVGHITKWLGGDDAWFSKGINLPYGTHDTEDQARRTLELKLTEWFARCSFPTDLFCQ